MNRGKRGLWTGWSGDVAKKGQKKCTVLAGFWYTLVGDVRGEGREARWRWKTRVAETVDGTKCGVRRRCGVSLGDD